MIFLKIIALHDIFDNDFQFNLNNSKEFYKLKLILF